jgi:2-phospho-L-lactate guanylyltransferase
VSEPRTVIVVPLKDFALAKSRLRSLFNDAALEDLVRSLASRVVAAASPRDCVVVADSDDVYQFARHCGVGFLRVSAKNLNGAITESLTQLRSDYEVAVIAHGDLADPRGLGTFQFDSGVTIVTDRHGTGTNVLAVPLDIGFVTKFGPDSAAAHARHAQQLAVAVRTITDSPWGLDIDEPVDWEISQQLPK